VTINKEPSPEPNAPFGESAACETNAGAHLDVGEWELCFAWHPVRLYGTGRFAWLRKISRRPVFIGSFRLKTDYTDSPSEVPAVDRLLL
jgi:hypothetical protein